MISLKEIIIVSVVLVLGRRVLSGISIERPGESDPFTWDGCVFRRVDIIHNENVGTNCTLCSVSGTTEAVFKSETKERYRNCTVECRKPTICTVYTYKLGNTTRPECYQCEPWTGENIFFKFKRGYEICSAECKKCARTVDLATASQCAFSCLGKPTFCYTTKTWFGNEMCFQSNFTYGCLYNDKMEMANAVSRGAEYQDCLKCARTAEWVDRHLCALDCKGRASYQESGINGKPFLYQCSIGHYQDVFEHEIPEEIKTHIMDKFGSIASQNLTVHPLF